MISVQVWALPRGGDPVPLPDLGDYTLSPLAAGAGGVELHYPADGRNFAVLHSITEDDVDLEIAIRTDGTAATEQRAILFDAQGDENAEGAVWTFGGNYLPILLTDACLPYAVGGFDADGDGQDEVGETKFQQATAGEIFATIIGDAQARGTLVGIDYSSFTAVNDSNGTPWQKALTVAFSPGRDYAAILADLEDRGVCEGELTAARQFKLYNPGTRGVDRTLPPNPVVIERGRDQVDAPLRHTVRDAGTVLLGAGKAISTSVTNEDALARRGRRIERFQSYNDVTDVGTLAALTQAGAVLIGDGASEQSHELVLLPGHPIPGQDFQVADWVWSVTRTGLKRRRVAQWTLTRSGEDVKATVTLDDLIDDRNLKLTRQIAALQGGTVAVGTPTPPSTSDGTTPPAKAPATPAGLVAESLAYEDPGPPSTIASAVTASYVEVTTSADGTPVQSTPRYRVRYRYLTGDAALNQTVPYPTLWLATPDDGYNWLAGGESTTTTLSFSGLSPGLGIELQVAAVIDLDPDKQPYEVDDHGRSFRRTELQSTWSAGVQITTGADATAPSAPSTPVVTHGVGSMLRVNWDGLDAAGADMKTANPDWAWVDVHLSTVNNFVPDESTYKDRLFGAGSITITDTLLYGVTYYARLVAVDLTGNASDSSAIGSGSPAQLADGDLASLSVEKLTSGVGTFDLLLAGRIKTGDTGARIEFDNASFRQYNPAGELKTQFVAADGSALITGTIQTALSGQRVVMLPSGSWRLYPSTGTNYNEILNNGNELVIRGQLDTQGRSGYVRASSLGIATQFGVPGQSVTAQVSVGSSNIDLTSPINGIRCDKRFATADGNIHTNVLIFNDENGNDIAGSVIQHREWNTNAVALACPGRNANLLFNNGDSKAIQMVYNDGNYADIKCGNVYAPNVVAPSGIATKQNVGDVEFSPLEVIRRSPSKRWQYRTDGVAPHPPAHPAPVRLRRRKRHAHRDTPHTHDFDHVEMPPHHTDHQPKPTDRVGPIADDIRAVAPGLVHTMPDGNLALSYGDLIGVLWKAVEELSDKLDQVLDRHDDIPALPGRPAGGKDTTS
jgi:hypothetical protein